MDIDNSVNSQQYLTFMLGDELYAIEVLKSREILSYTKITKIPKTPSFMSGVINLRGSVVPIVDLRETMEMKVNEITKKTSIVISEITLDNEIIILGMIVDAVKDVIDLQPDQIGLPPQIGSKVKVEFIKGMGKKGDDFIIILDLDKILSENYILQIKSMSENIKSDEVKD